jgi:hypothetical protein
MDAKPKRRWFHLTPGLFLAILLGIELLLWLSDRHQWFEFNQHKGWTVLIAVASVAAFLAGMMLCLVIALVFRVRFQYSVRLLLVLVVVVALPCSWLAVEMKKASGQQAAVEAIKATSGSVTYDFEPDPFGKRITAATPRTPQWLRELLGDDFFHCVFGVRLGTDDAFEQAGTLHDLRSIHVFCSGRVTDASLVHLQGLPQLRTLHFGANNVTDAGLASLSGLASLERLEMRWMRITDAGLKHLEGLPRLRALWLGEGITDAGLVHVIRFAHLEELSLLESRVTDDGLQQLRCLGGLQRLDLRGTKVTEAGVKKFQQALPNCRIEY